jgi:hypothetical protein
MEFNINLGRGHILQPVNAEEDSPHLRLPFLTCIMTRAADEYALILMQELLIESGAIRGIKGVMGCYFGLQ